MTESAERPRASREEIARQVTPEQALYFSKAAYDNASRLVDAAVLLHTHGHHGPARSLAISAREEFGKYFAALLHCAGVYDAQAFAALLRQHHMKQTLGATLAFVGGPLRALSDRLAPALQVNAGTVQDAFHAIGENLKAALSDMKVPPVDESAIAEVQARVSRAHSGADDARRTEGLYADLVSTDSALEIQSPSAVTAADALEEIETARAYVAWATPIMEAMTIGEFDEKSHVPVQEVIAGLRYLARIVTPSDPGSGTPGA